MPPPFAEPGIGDIQPFFDGEEALFRQGLDIVSVAYKGGDIFNPSAWASPSSIVTSDAEGFLGKKVGVIFTTGEPTRAVVDGVSEIYFVYGVVEDDDTFNLNIGVVSER